MGKTKSLSDIEWCKLAVSDDEARPVLMGIHVDLDQKRIEGTDGHRLHFAPFLSTNLRAGIFELGKDTDLGAEIEGRYPNTSYVIPSFDWSPAVLMGNKLVHARAICKAAVAANRALRGSSMPNYFVTLTTHDGGIASYDPAYMLDALAMWTEQIPLQVFAPKPLNPARIQDAQGARVAILMPVRREAAKAERFSLDEFMYYAKDEAKPSWSMKVPV